VGISTVYKNFGFWSRRFEKIFSELLLFRYHLSSKRGVFLNLKKLDYPPPKDDVPTLVKIGVRVLDQEVENEKNLHTDRWTTGDQNSSRLDRLAQVLNLKSTKYINFIGYL
jgi:hypothetical protein